MSFPLVLRIRIHQIHMFLGLPDPDPLVRGMDPDTDPVYHQAKIVRKTFIPTVCDFFLTLENDVNVPVPSKSMIHKQKNLFFN
jgi:hypothetical protein